MKALGTKISELRKARGMTQDELADKMGVSPQAVSKWENDLSMPDLPVLIELSDFFHISLDDFLKEKVQTVELLPEDKRKDIEQMFLRVYVDSENGDRVRVNLPLALVKMARDMGLDIRQSNDAENRSGNDYAADREWCDREACRSRFCKRRSC